MAFTCDNVLLFWKKKVNFGIHFANCKFIVNDDMHFLFYLMCVHKSHRQSNCQEGEVRQKENPTKPKVIAKWSYNLLKHVKDISKLFLTICQSWNMNMAGAQTGQVTLAIQEVKSLCMQAHTKSPING